MRYVDAEKPVPARHIYVKTNCTICDDVIHRVKFDVTAGRRVMCLPCIRDDKRRRGKLRRDSDKWVTVTCAVCAKEFERMRYRVDRAKTAITCSIRCRGEAIRLGTIVRKWKPRPHRDGYMYYGAEWRQQRDAARARDGHACRECGATAAVRPLHVHHIIRFGDFATSAEANNLSNLITLCALCHRRTDAVLTMARRAEGRNARRVARPDKPGERKLRSQQFEQLADLIPLLVRNWRVTRRKGQLPIEGENAFALGLALSNAGTARGYKNSRGLYLAADRCQVVTFSHANAEIEADCWRFTLAGEAIPDPRPWSELLASGDHKRVAAAERVAFLDWQQPDSDDHVITGAGRARNLPATKRLWRASDV